MVMCKTERSYQCIHELFRVQAEQAPENVALVFGEKQLTFRELNERSNQLAHYLRKMGVRPEVLVGICMERSFDLVIGLLGILKAGGAYVPLDPQYPKERLEFMLKDARAAILITQSHLWNDLIMPGRMVVCLDQEQGVISCESNENAINENIPENLAYLTYTSGSTGQPKAAQIPHRAIFGFMFGVDYVRFDSRQIFFQYSSVSWDALTLELWPALLLGACCVLYAGSVINLQDLARTIQKSGITTLWLTSSLFNALIDLVPESLKNAGQLLIGGEELSSSHVRRAFELLPDMQIVNGYGPSECTVFACCYPVPRTFDDNNSIPIGRPIGDRSVYLLDRYENYVPIGVVGELYIGGPGLARGYHHSPDLTAEKFIPDPFSGEAGGRLYKTGDLGRYLADGNIEFLGRLDDQVKIRGYRIELGEIENVIRGYEGVGEAVVVAREDEPGQKRLVGYVVWRGGHEGSVGELRGYLQGKLPEYMVPGLFVVMDKLPLTANGKLDRKALPRPEGRAAGTGDEMIEPRTPEEELMAGLWRQVLQLKEVGIDDNFFELGGHSLLATQLVSRVREAFGVELALRNLFEAPTIGKLTRRMELVRMDGNSPVPEMVVVDRGEALPLSYAQERLWFLDQLMPGSSAYNIASAVRIRGELAVEVLERAVEELVRRHEVLRTTIEVREGKAVQVIHSGCGVKVAVMSLEGQERGEQEMRLKEMGLREGQEPFDLERGPLIRVKLVKIGAQEHVLFLTMHHIVSDGWSMGVLVRELGQLYEAFLKGEASPLKALPVQYADYAVWQRGWLQGRCWRSRWDIGVNS